MSKEYKAITFIRFEWKAPKRAKGVGQVDDNDILRAVLLAEDFPDGRWVVFRCHDRMHAIKVAHRIREFGFNVTVIAHDNEVWLQYGAH